MNMKQILLAAVAGLTLTAGAAYAEPPHGGPHYGPPAGWHGGDRHDHDRYWRPEYRHGYVQRDMIYAGLRHRHYYGFEGAPYFYHDRYVVRCYRGGRVVLVEVDPYTGLFLGEVRF